MVELIEEEGPRLSPLSVAAFLLTAVLGGAIIWNAFSQDTLPRDAATFEVPPGPAQAVQPASPGGTVTLRFDPAIEEVQRELAASGYYQGAIDGVAGRRTRAAIEAFQTANGLDVTGVATPELAERIRYARQIAEAAGITATTEQAPASPPPAANAADALVMQVQQDLAELGYLQGGASGRMSEDTRAAIRAFEFDRGLPETGEISDGLLAELAKTTGLSSLPAE
jgi:peptidoglycan hydrolase-like protein with peptidoglycan-binding domain